MIFLVGKSGEERPLRQFIIPFLFVAALFFVLFTRQADTPYVTIQLNGHTMGTTYMVKVVLPRDEQRKSGPISTAINDALQRVNGSMSTYQKDSELSRFNSNGNITPVPASDGLRFVARRALEISKASMGAFDPTVGPLVNAWGFGPAGPQKQPTQEELAALRAKVGYEKLTVNEQNKTIQKSQPDIYVDLSAIAKGYGVDQVALALDGLGLGDYLVEIGGELRGKGLNRRRLPWRVAVEKPVASRGEIHINAIIDLGDQAMATSGDYRNYDEKNGQRISHTIDPATGKPITHRLASATVVAETCASADAWATALNVLGPDRGLALAEERGLKAFFLVKRSGDGFEERATTAFEQLRKASVRHRPTVPKSDMIKP